VGQRSYLPADPIQEKKLATTHCPLPLFLHQKENPCSEVWLYKKKNNNTTQTDIAAN
jgi:hypothetical protein